MSTSKSYYLDNKMQLGFITNLIGICIHLSSKHVFKTKAHPPLAIATHSNYSVELHSYPLAVEHHFPTTVLFGYPTSIYSLALCTGSGLHL